jgi:hypothetical protein
MKTFVIAASLVGTAHAVVAQPETCTDTSNGAVGSVDQNCDAYHGHEQYCGPVTDGFIYDDEDFASNDMCCACGGGTTTADDGVYFAAGDVPTCAYDDATGRTTVYYQSEQHLGFKCEHTTATDCECVSTYDTVSKTHSHAEAADATCIEFNHELDGAFHNVNDNNCDDMSTTTATPTTTTPTTGATHVEWTELSGDALVTASGNLKALDTDWDAGAISTKHPDGEFSIQFSTDAYTTTGAGVMVGLSSSEDGKLNTSNSWDDFDCAMFFSRSGLVQMWWGDGGGGAGSDRIVTMEFTSEDKFAMTRDADGLVQFYINGEYQADCSLPITGPAHVDTTLKCDSDCEITDVLILEGVVTADAADFGV